MVPYYIFMTLFVILTESDATLTIPENFTETYPILNLKSYKLFAKNRTVEQNQTHFRLPRVFDELVFECNSTLPAKWNFFNEQVKKIDIKKWRLYNKTPGNDSVGWLFYTTFKVSLNNPHHMLNLSCENDCPTGVPKCKYLNTFLKNTVSAEESPGYFELQYSHGNKYLRRRLQDQNRGVTISARLGHNHGCKYLLNVDMETGAYACMLADGSEKEVLSVFVPCNNPDECNAVFRYNGDNCTTGTTFKPNCTSSICSELRDTSSLFVLACGDNNENSIAKGFYKTLADIQSGGKALRTGIETTTEDPQLYISKKTIRFDSPLITSVVCQAPNWNELNMTNFTMHVSVAESIPPFFIKYEENIPTKVQAKLIFGNVTSTSQKLSCERSGLPPATIEWHFDGIKPEQTNGNGTLVQHYTLMNQSDTESEVVLGPNHPFKEVVCVANNAAGEARLYYRFTQDGGSRVDVPILSGVVVSALFLITVVIVLAFYKIRKTQQGAYLSD
ncbi:unnamed protein product, partial [Allacma fusca]